MSVAQQLYEGIDVKGHGTIGLITYMRTDSVRVSKEAQEAANDYILNEYGKEYLPPSPKLYKSKKNIQDAHEAIRPTYIELTPGMVKSSLKDDQYKLYNLIWSRFMASQMANCILNTLSIEIKNGEYTFRASGSNVKFEGFMRVYKYNIEEDEHNEKIPLLQKGDLLHTDKIDGKQHFTQPPARFTEASLVKTLEENGIGRPSTYAPIISTLIDRKYVKKEKKAIFPTELGNIVDNILSDYFKQIIDIEFTADMENKLDNVEEGKENWKEIVDEYFKPLKEAIDIAEKEVAKITIEDEVTDIKCDKCGRNMVIKHGRFGDFLACPGYPDCKNTKPIVEKLKVKCPKCGGDVIVRRSKKGRKFFGCSNYPDCDFVSWFEPTEENCPNCGSFMVKKFSKAKGYYLQCSNQECKYEKSNPDPDKK